MTYSKASLAVIRYAEDNRTESNCTH